MKKRTEGLQQTLLVILPRSRKVESWQWDGTLEAMYAKIGNKCGLVEFHRINAQRDGVFVDEEGKMKPVTHNDFFMVNGFPQPLCGVGIVAGVDGKGDTITPSVAADWLRQNVWWNY